MSIRVSRTIDATPQEVYELVSDVRRMPEWSPEVTEARWLGSEPGARIGARFEGTNRISVDGSKPLT